MPPLQHRIRDYRIALDIVDGGHLSRSRRSIRAKGIGLDRVKESRLGGGVGGVIGGDDAVFSIPDCGYWRVEQFYTSSSSAWKSDDGIR